jgi:hypothetical protein
MGFGYAGFRRSTGQPIELTVVTFAESVDRGVSSVVWSMDGCETSTGDGLFVDAMVATTRWASIGDVVVHPPQARRARQLVAVLPLANGRWLLQSDDDTVTVALPCTFLPCMAAFYGWLLCGRRLAEWPFEVMAGLSGRVRRGGCA